MKIHENEKPSFHKLNTSKSNLHNMPQLHEQKENTQTKTIKSKKKETCERKEN